MRWDHGHVITNNTVISFIQINVSYKHGRRRHSKKNPKINFVIVKLKKIIFVGHNSSWFLKSILIVIKNIIVITQKCKFIWKVNLFLYFFKGKRCWVTKNLNRFENLLLLLVSWWRRGREIKLATPGWDPDAMLTQSLTLALMNMLLFI